MTNTQERSVSFGNRSFFFVKVPMVKLPAQIAEHYGRGLLAGIIKNLLHCRKKSINLFIMMFDSGEIVMDTQYPLTEEDTEFRFEFADPNNSAMVLSYASEKLYYGQQEYLELSKIPSQLNSWFKKAGVAG